MSAASEVFVAFLRLGCTSFGGPIAHLGYFRSEFVQRRAWLGDEQYASLLVLCHLLPGPSSSQMAFALGLLRARWLGALAAFVAFTLPSVILLIAFAMASASLGAGFDPVIHGLKLVAVCVVAQAIYAMSKSFLTDWRRWLFAVSGTLVMSQAHGASVQVGVILLSAMLGAIALRDNHTSRKISIVIPHGKRIAYAMFFAYCALLAVSLVVATNSIFIHANAAMYRAGALVFGGGHVVLPLLEESLVKPGLLSASDFIAGYGAAQAVPGPMFSFAAYIGMRVDGLAAAIACTLAIFLPGFLLMGAALPLWNTLFASARMRSTLAGVNAAVIGMLAAAFYDPVLATALRDFSDVGISAVGLLMLLRWRVSTLWIIAWCVFAASIAHFHSVNV